MHNIIVSVDIHGKIYREHLERMHAPKFALHAQVEGDRRKTAHIMNQQPTAYAANNFRKLHMHTRDS